MLFQTGKIVAYVNNAHERLITSLKFLTNSNNLNDKSTDVPKPILLFSSSRDRTVKMWSLNCDKTPTKNWSICLEQTIEGHVHSVWDIDCTPEYLVAGSADKSIRVWKNSLNIDHNEDLGNNINFKSKK